MKKMIWGIIGGGVVLLIGAFLMGRYVFPESGEAPLPNPEVATVGKNAEMEVDKNINMDTIDNYLGRRDVVYRDLRMLVDPAEYEAIGGDPFLSGFIEGFEVVPFPYLVNLTSVPEGVGGFYDGETLFLFDGENYTPLYEESMAVLENLFPRDKVIFLMCGGGVYARAMKNMLVALGWDKEKIYNVGGYWDYDGDNKVEVARKISDTDLRYDFYKIPYHSFDFGVFTKK